MGTPVSLAGASPSVASGSGQEIVLNAERFDGFAGPITVDIGGLPPGYGVSSPVVIEAGHVQAKAVIVASADAPPPCDNSIAVPRIPNTAFDRFMALLPSAGTRAGGMPGTCLACMPEPVDRPAGGSPSAHYSGRASASISGILATPFAGRFALYGSHGWAEIVDKEHPETPEGWVMNVRLRGEKVRTREFPPAPTVLANLEAFADAALGGAAYPVTHREMRATICGLEAIIRSCASGAIEAVAN